MSPTGWSLVALAWRGILLGDIWRRWPLVDPNRGVPIAAQGLFYPVTDPNGSRWGERVNPGLKADNMRWCWDAYAPDAADRETPDVTPMIGPHAGLPPTLVITAEYDILAAEGEAYAEVLAEAGVPVVTFQARGQIHGFVRRLRRFDAAAAAVDLAGGFLRRHLGP